MGPAGFAHSEIRGSSGMCPSPRLIAACHVLRRLPVPRHPPCARTIFSSSTVWCIRTYTPGPGGPGRSDAIFLEKRKYRLCHAMRLSRYAGGEPSGPDAAPPKGRQEAGPAGRRAPAIGSLFFQEVCLPRKEVIQPHLPVRLPCYDFTPLALHTFGASPQKGWAGDFGCRRLGWCDGRCVQGPGTHSPRRADPRLLATPTSRRRVAASDPNWGRLWGFAPARAVATRCAGHCSTCAAQGIRGMMT